MHGCILRVQYLLLSTATAYLGGCASDSRTVGNDFGPVSGTSSSAGETGGDDGAASDEGEDSSAGDDAGDTDGPPKLDIDPGEGDGSGEDGGGDGECEFPHTPCDDGTDNPFAAMGINCPGEPVASTATTGSAAGIGVRTGYGPTPVFDPREGQAFAVLSSGHVAEIDTPSDGDGVFPSVCSTDHDGLGSNVELGPFDPDGNLPPPIIPADVAGDCLADPGLIGTGDCSNTVYGQWSQSMGPSARDYVDLRIEATVPSNVTSFSYDLAYFTVEYPEYLNSSYNDIYIGWLESEAWTGNISFDDAGSPISVNAAFLEYKDDTGTLPELQGTCMMTHGGTDWLRSTAPVVPGEEITLVFAMMDLSDSILDSFVFLDNFQWGCEGGPPSTIPVD